MLTDVTNIFNHAADTLGLPATALAGPIEGAVINQVAHIGGNIINALVKLIFSVDLQKEGNSANLAPFKPLFEGGIAAIVGMFGVLTDRIPGILDTINGVLGTILGPLYPIVKGAIGFFANTFLGSE